ncbi:unnamed protein product [Penicillium bialowiezense]
MSKSLIRASDRIAPAPEITRAGVEILPAPGAGQHLQVAGPWAQRLMGPIYFSNGMSDPIAAQTVSDLQALPALNEPFLSASRAMTASSLDAFLKGNESNALSGLITVVGQKMEIENECGYCKDRTGPWARCAVVQGTAGKGLACNNCHRVGRGLLCEKYVHPGSVPLVRPHRQQRRIQTPSVDQHTMAQQGIQHQSVDAGLEGLELLVNCIDRVLERVIRADDAYANGSLRPTHIQELRLEIKILSDTWRALRHPGT